MGQHVVVELLGGFVDLRALRALMDIDGVLRRQLLERFKIL